MEFEVNQVVMTYDPKTKTYQESVIKNIRKNVPSNFDDYIYPILYDVQFVYDGRLSKGHFESSLKLN